MTWVKQLTSFFCRGTEKICDRYHFVIIGNHLRETRFAGPSVTASGDSLLSVYTYVIYDFCMNNWVLEMVDVPHCSMFTHTQLYLFIYLHQISKQTQILLNCHVVEFIEVISVNCNGFTVLLLHRSRISWSLITEHIDKALTLLLPPYTDVFPIKSICILMLRLWNNVFS